MRPGQKENPSFIAWVYVAQKLLSRKSAGQQILIRNRQQIRFLKTYVRKNS